MTAAAELTVTRLGARGVLARIVSQRLNRRKIDLIPLPEWADPPKARIRDLLAAVEKRLQQAGVGSLGEVVAIAAAAARDVGLREARVTSDAKHVEIGLTDKSDAARWIFNDLWNRGIGPGLVLIAGDEFGSLGGLPGSDSLMLDPWAARATAVSVGVEPSGVPPSVTWLPGGPEVFLGLLEDQLRRRRDRSIPEIDSDPNWTYTVIGLDRTMERARETLLNLADGRFGTSGAPLDSDPDTSPRVLAAGVYVGRGAASELLSGPLWDRLGPTATDGSAMRRTLDLRSGALYEEVSTGGQYRRAIRFQSLARPGTVALRSEGSRRLIPEGPPIVPAGSSTQTNAGVTRGRQWMTVASKPGGVAVAATEVRATDSGVERLERIAAYVADPRRAPSPGPALSALHEAAGTGFDWLLREQRAAWAQRWTEADVRITGDPDLENAVRFALFHLMASVADHGETAVGARGVSGSAYRGHVFWDSEVFVLPVLAATHPAAARAMLEYRLRRLPVAQAAATKLGREGARFPWESALVGSDVTPRLARDHSGRTVEIRTGLMEEHITADVAWAVRTYVDWSGDREFWTEGGRGLVLETARYWASRISRGEDGRAHIVAVIGPDEYHEGVDDDAFTNVMARWNLRLASRVAGVAPAEHRRWRELARLLVDGYDRTTGVYEQFAGFNRLEPLIIADIVRRRPVAADLLLGPDRVRGAQVVKQADVLMLHHMVPDATATGSLVPNLEFYEPRTAHGSSLSPGVHAALFARAGRLDEALAMLNVTARLDLDDLTRT
ncbi:MAG TPA: hypothetical protein VNF73_01280, partial [Candidatus Saccharimonadales bacterium]|nr:hypothetical protein [Candidatus Saccharimonadales bacterium]